MADEAASKYVDNRGVMVRERATISSDKTVVGDRVIWVIDTDGADITLSNELGQKGELTAMPDGVPQPVMIVKCAVDASGTNCLVKDEAGNTLFTFSADHSSTPAYAAFRLVSGDRNSVAWELA